MLKTIKKKKSNLVQQPMIHNEGLSQKTITTQVQKVKDVHGLLRVAAALQVVLDLYASAPGKIDDVIRRNLGGFPGHKYTHTYKFRC